MDFQRLAFACALALVASSCSDTSGPTTTCGAGTQNVDGECVTIVQCGEGTTNVDNVCVPVNGATCGAGTQEVDGLCVPTDEACTEGTHLNPDTGLCVPDFEVVCGAGTELGPDDTCVPSDPVNCGAGTILVDGECIPIGVDCDAWEAWNPDTQECELNTAALCGAGTLWSSEACVPDSEAVCGTGTIWSGNACICTDPVACGDFGQPCCAGDFPCISVQICCVGASYPPEGECRYSCD